jgi:hypothetical protein
MKELLFWRKYAQEQVDLRGEAADLVIPAHVFLDLTIPLEALEVANDELRTELAAIWDIVEPFSHQDDGPLYQIRQMLVGFVE